MIDVRLGSKYLSVTFYNQFVWHYITSYYHWMFALLFIRIFIKKTNFTYLFPSNKSCNPWTHTSAIFDPSVTKLIFRSGWFSNLKWRRNWRCRKWYLNRSSYWRLSPWIIFVMLIIGTLFRDYSFSACGKFPKKLTFFNPWYSHIRVGKGFRNANFLG